jgi:NTE family protein
MAQLITNLVFEGGGVKGIAYAGAIDVLETANILTSVERVAGTSAGAITATLLSLRYDSAAFSKILNKISFPSFQDGWDPLRIPFTYGLYKGDAFLKWIKQQIANNTFKPLSPNATFKDFNAAGMRDLYVFATDLNTQNVKEFSFEKTPTVIVAEAVRASMSIPLFFKAWQFPSGNPDNHIYVDGGTVFNYPLTVFDSGLVPNPETLGFNLSNITGTKQPNNLGFDQLGKYITNLFNTLLNAQEIDFIQNTTDTNRSVFIDDFGIAATDFDITPAQKQQLITSGRDATTQYLASHQVV